MKFLTIRQPWASLIAVGAKTIETRGWSTTYRGPLAIHAGKAKPEHLSWVGKWSMHTRYLDPGDEAQMRRMVGVGQMGGGAGIVSVPLPLGAVVAVCDLVDVVPIVPEKGLTTAERSETGGKIAVSDPATCPIGLSYTRFVWKNTSSGRGLYSDIDATAKLRGQIPFGDFTPGRFAWLLDNVRPIDPVPMKGAQGLRDVPAVLAQIEGVTQ